MVLEGPGTPGCNYLQIGNASASGGVESAGNADPLEAIMLRAKETGFDNCSLGPSIFLITHAA